MFGPSYKCDMKIYNYYFSTREQSQSQSFEHYMASLKISKVNHAILKLWMTACLDIQGVHKVLDGL